MNSLKGMLGLAMKAGALACGSESVITAARKGKAKLVLIASDVSENTQKKLRDKVAWNKVPAEALPLSMAELASAVGKQNCAAAAILTNDFVAFYKRVSGTTNQEVANYGDNK